MSKENKKLIKLKNKNKMKNFSILTIYVFYVPFQYFIFSIQFIATWASQLGASIMLEISNP
jgi:hypothetical protein